MKCFFLVSLGVLVSGCGGAAGSGTQISQSDMLGSTQAGAGNSNPANAGSGTQGTTTGQMGSAGGSDANGGSGNSIADQMGMVVNGGRGGSSDGDAAGASSGGNDAEPEGGAGGVANAGGVGGVAGTGITIITAGAGAGAGAGAVCTDTAPDQTSGAAAGTVEATAGTFTDHCDENGDLVEYSCEVHYVPPPNCVGVTGPGASALPAAAAPLADIVAPICGNPAAIVTGNVTEVVTACGGRCQDAACPLECPDYDEPMTYVSIDPETGAAVFAFDRVGHDLSCELIFDRDTDTYDCKADPEAEREIVVPSLGISSRFCLEGDIGNIGMDDPTYDGEEECAYRCDVLLR